MTLSESQYYWRKHLKKGGRMKTSDRREFLSIMLKGAGIGFLSLLPGTFFHRLAAFAAEPTPKTDFNSVLKSTNRSNYINILNASKLSQEDKLAIAAVRELSRSDFNKLLAGIGKPGPSGIGNGCGNNCIDHTKISKKSPSAIGNFCGMGCNAAKIPSTSPVAIGNGCGSKCSVPANATGVLDRYGKLNTTLGSFSIANVLQSMRRAQKIVY
jgi:hypothetical protein